MVIWKLDLQLPVPITTKFVSLIPIHGKVYSLCDKFVRDLRHVCGFLRVFRFPPTIKTDCHDKIEILLKVTLNM